MGLYNTGGVTNKCVQMLDKNYGTLGPDGPGELKESPGRRELEESSKEKGLGRWRTEIGVERKERRGTPVALETWKECLKR
ncbi:hypothetical protein TNCV_388681 [Trichonephila clavipes]|nr:hypothetical protein TNCV_388681 [Trichonephila clavipes]